MGSRRPSASEGDIGPMPVIESLSEDNFLTEVTKTKSMSPSSVSTQCDTDSNTGRCFLPTAKEDWCSPEQTIIVFDWDDTLCPSSWIRANRPVLSYFNPPPKEECYEEPLRALEKQVVKLLRTAMQLGQVVIVTNAKENWVPISAKNFLPSVLPLLEFIPVVYSQTLWNQWGVDSLGICEARSSRKKELDFPEYEELSQAMVAMHRKLYGSEFNTCLEDALRGRPDSNPVMYLDDGMNPFQREVNMCFLWKELAIGSEVAAFYKNLGSDHPWTNAISIGDSDYERMALYTSSEACSPKQNDTQKSRSKTIKMVEQPDIHELIVQVQQIEEKLQELVGVDGDMDIEIDDFELVLEIP